MNFHGGHQHGEGLEDLPCEEKLRVWVLFSLVKRWLWRDLTAAWSYPEKTMENGNEWPFGGMAVKDVNIKSGPQVPEDCEAGDRPYLYRLNCGYCVVVAS